MSSSSPPPPSSRPRELLGLSPQVYGGETSSDYGAPRSRHGETRMSGTGKKKKKKHSHISTGSSYQSSRQHQSHNHYRKGASSSVASLGRRRQSSLSTHIDDTGRHHHKSSSQESLSVAEKSYQESISKARRTSGLTVRSNKSSTSSSSKSTVPTKIALFGVYGKTGHYFLRAALDAGYNVHVLVTPELLQENNRLVEEFSAATAQHQVQWITGTLEEPSKVGLCLRHADFVVCMLSDTLPTKNKEYPVGHLTSFVQLLYPLMKNEPSIQVFLYQATSLAEDIRGFTPILSKVLKTVAHGRNLFLQDQDTVIRHVALEHGHRLRNRLSNATGERRSIAADGENDSFAEENDKENESSMTDSSKANFAFVITRPTFLLKDGPSTKKLCASKSQPGPFPVSHVDLAEFSLNALLMEKLHNSCPYVVADSF